MGVDDDHQGWGYGTTLLLHAYGTACDSLSTIGHVGLIVDPKNDVLGEFYARHGFEKLTRKDRRMFIPTKRMKEVRGAMGAGE
jgi:GNAT superfamily N-acetyltransferase